MSLCALELSLYATATDVPTSNDNVERRAALMCTEEKT
jgi:hypothetical protein